MPCRCGAGSLCLAPRRPGLGCPPRRDGLREGAGSAAARLRRCVLPSHPSPAHPVQRWMLRGSGRRLRFGCIFDGASFPCGTRATQTLSRRPYCFWAKQLELRLETGLGGGPASGLGVRPRAVPQSDEHVQMCGDAALQHERLNNSGRFAGSAAGRTVTADITEGSAVRAVGCPAWETQPAEREV